MVAGMLHWNAPAALQSASCGKSNWVRRFFEVESIGLGDNWGRAVERAVEEDLDIVFVLSPDFRSSEWVEVGRTSGVASTTYTA